MTASESYRLRLTPSQQAALHHINTYARGRKDAAQATIRHILRMSNISQNNFDECVGKVKAHARVALHFHPDRLDKNQQSVAQSMLSHGIYKSQFETLISNGSVSAVPGGDRDLWEQKIFGGAYTFDSAAVSERPKYGALNLMLHSDGPAPRFGSCYFLLNPTVSHRCTFTFLDSHNDPAEKGTYDEFDDIMAALLTETFTRDFAIGETDITPAQLIRHLEANLERPLLDTLSQPPARNLNHYIEAQVHGDISLKDDVEALVADSSFKGTEIGPLLERKCARYNIDLHWHGGFALHQDEVPSDFRGPAMPSLARTISSNGYINAHLIGQAAQSLKSNPATFRDRGTFDEVLQELKLLWHVLVKYGHPKLQEA